LLNFIEPFAKGIARPDEPVGRASALARLFFKLLQSFAMTTLMD